MMFKYWIDCDDGAGFYRFASLAAVKRFLRNEDFSLDSFVRVYVKASNPWDCFNALSAEFSVRSLLAKSAQGVLSSCNHWCVI